MSALRSLRKHAQMLRLQDGKHSVWQRDLLWTGRDKELTVHTQLDVQIVRALLCRRLECRGAVSGLRALRHVHHAMMLAVPSATGRQVVL